MTNTLKKSVTQEVIEMGYKPTLIVSKRLKHEIDYMHNKYPGLEWSGSLIYSYEGDHQNYNDMVITCHRFILCDLGTAGATDFNFTEHIEYVYENIPQLPAGEVSRGLLHSH